MKRSQLIVLYAVAIIVGITFLTLKAISVKAISHDDIIAYLAATGHQGEYASSHPRQQWVTAGDWQVFWTHDQFGCFGTIGRDLGTHDIHPPLYFWFLHVWSFLYGITLKTGPLLNILFHIVACITISAACRFLKCPLWIAGAVGVLWLFSGANLTVATETRPYSLLAAFSALFIVSLLYFLDKPSWKTSFWLCLICTCGMLTHYHFALVLAVCGAVAALQTLVAKQWRTCFMLAASLTLAGLIFFLLHPKFYMSFQLQAVQAEPFVWADVIPRLRTSTRAMLEMFIPFRVGQVLADVSWRFWLPIWIGVLAGTWGLLLLAKSQVRTKLADSLKRSTSIPSVGTILCIAALVLLYVFCFSPQHAMRAKYLMVISPLLFIALSQLFAVLDKNRQKWAVVVVVGLLISQTAYGTISTFLSVSRASQSQTLANPLKNRDALLVLDTTARGVLPTVLWHADPAMHVFAAKQEFLLADGLPGMPAHEVIVYVSDHRYGNSRAGTESILRMFSNHGYVIIESLKTNLWTSETYVLKRAGPVTPPNKEFE